MPSPPALHADRLTVRYGETVALDAISVTVGPGERVGLLGRNGSGKTSLLRVAATRRAPTSGRVSICGLDASTQADAARQHLGVVFQSPALDPALTCRETLALQAALAGLPRRDRRDRLAEALDDAGLTERADQRTGALSGGLARRLDLVRGLLHRPALALLDEPTAGLDPLARQSFWDVLDRRRVDGAQVIATHDLAEAERCDRVVILDQGHVQADGAPHDLTARLGPDALWLDTDTPEALAEALTEQGLDARARDGRVLVQARDARDQVARLYARPDVRGVTIQPPSLADVVASLAHLPR